MASNHKQEFQNKSVKNRLHPKSYQLLQSKFRIDQIISAEHNIAIYTYLTQCIGKPHIKVHRIGTDLGLFKNTTVIDRMEEDDQQHGDNAQQVQICISLFSIAHFFNTPLSL